MIIYNKKDIPGPAAYGNPDAAMKRPGVMREWVVSVICGQKSCLRLIISSQSAARKVLVSYMCCVELSPCMGAGGRFSTAVVPNYIDLEQKRAAKIPGPGDYQWTAKATVGHPACRHFVSKATISDVLLKVLVGSGRNCGRLGMLSVVLNAMLIILVRVDNHGANRVHRHPWTC